LPRPEDDDRAGTEVPGDRERAAWHQVTGSAAGLDANWRRSSRER
jgi:hypothetical protein